jgi:copper transport protein
MFSVRRVLSPATLWRSLFLALFLAVGVFLLFPGKSEAHAILLRSDPARDAVLPRAPDRVRLWFSEDLNSSLSTAFVVNGTNTHVDLGNARVLTTDPTEMDVNLKSALKPSVYTVVYRSVANDDGHILTGSFPFTIALPDGMVPQLRPGAQPGVNALGTTSLNGPSPGQFDGVVLVNLLMLTLVELGAVFYAGAAIWHLFVLRSPSPSDSAREEANQRARERFARCLAIPLVCVLLLANSGVLVGQALTVTEGNWGKAFAPTLLITLCTSGRFGLFWRVRSVVLVLALPLALLQWRTGRRSPRFTTMLSWIHLLFGLAFFGALTLSSHAAAASPEKVLMALVADWLHLVAAALWVGGMLYLALSYLPAQHKQSIATQARGLTTVLPLYSPWAVVGVIIMAVTGPLSATVHLTSWEQLFATTYGLALVVKGCLVGGLVLTSAIHVLLLRPRLQKAYGEYEHVQASVAMAEKVRVRVQGAQNTAREHVSATPRQLVYEVQFCEQRLARHTRLLTGVLRFEPILGVAVLVCVGLMNVFAGSLSPAGAFSQPSTGKTQGVHLSALTTDRQFMVRLNVTPGQIGSNGFLAHVEDAATGKSATNIWVSLSLSSLDMNMGTDTMDLQPDGAGDFRNTGNLTMGGNWQIRIQIRTLDKTLHEAPLKLQVSSARG